MPAPNKQVDGSTKSTGVFTVLFVPGPQTGPRPDGKGPLGFTLSFVTHGLLPVDSVLVLWIYGSTPMSILSATSSTTLSTSFIFVKRVVDSVLVRPFLRV